MGSVVTKNLLDYGIYAGNPAKLIRMRFPDDIIKEFTKIKWWNFSDEELEKYAKYFDRPLLFIEEYKK